MTLKAIVRKVKSELRGAANGEGGGADGGGDAPVKWPAEDRVAYLESVVDYLLWQTSNQAVLLRHLAASIAPDLPSVRQTKDSFDFQWAEIPIGRHMLGHPEFRKEATGYVTEFTRLPADWFKGKRVIDVGCGMGRYSWALCQLGADVLSLDQSEHGLRETAEACKDFPSHRVQQIDLLQPLSIAEPADLVWCFGVLHHTGDTYGAFRNIVPLVKPGGYLYLMIYGEPRRRIGTDFAEINEYEEWRHRTANLDLRSKLKAVREHMAAGGFRVKGEEYIHGYFDAISPAINDLHRFEEIESWMIEAGFVDITRTVDTRNLHLVGRKNPDRT
jgi:SAM-dependent methyltransferase